MRTRCPLCTREVASENRRWCECGKPMDARCFDAHDEWCAVRGTDSWIGALER